MKFSETLRGIGNPVAYYPGLAKVVGGVTSALFLCQINFWGDKGHADDGWIYKTQEALTKETGLTRSEQETARKNLKKIGVLEERNARLEHRLYYRVNEAALDVLWDAAFPNAQNQHSGERETSIPEATKPPSVSLAENTTENTTENTETLPDYMQDLIALNTEGRPIPLHPFKKTESEMMAWMSGKNITPRKADETAAYILGNWPGPRKTWKNVFAVFRTCVVKTFNNDQQAKGTKARRSRHDDLPTTEELKKAWG